MRVRVGDVIEPAALRRNVSSMIIYHYTNLTFVCDRVRCESGRSREAIRPELKTFSFSSKLKFDSTYYCH